LRNEVAKFVDPFINDSLQRLTTNEGNLASTEERFKVWPTSAMQNHVAKVIETHSAEQLSEFYSKPLYTLVKKKWVPPRPGVVEAYLFFAQMIRLYLDDDPEELPFELLELPAGERAQYMVEALIRHFQLVTIELEAEDDAQIIFETLNARGAPLTPSDLVRNFI